MTSTHSTLAFALGVLGLVGCARYSAKPLTERDVRQDLVPVDSAELRRRLSALHNPLIRSTRVDLEIGLSPADAAAVAVVMNPALREVRDGAQVTAALAGQNTLLPNPTLSYSLDIPLGSNSAGTVSGYGVGLDWEITSLISHHAKVRASEAAIEQNRLDVSWQEWQVAEAARLATYDVVALRSQLHDAEAISTQLQEIASRVRQALQQRQVTSIEASAVAAAANDADVRTATVKRDLHDAILAMNRAIGFSPEMIVPLRPSAEMPSSLDVPSNETLTEDLEVHRIDLVALRHGYESQESTVRAAILEQFPRITLGIANTRDYGNFLTLGPRLAIELPVFDHNQGNIAIQRATRQRLYDEYISRVFEARSDVARATAAISHLNEIIRVQTVAVTGLHVLLDTEDHALHAGSVNLNTFYAAAVDLAQRQADLGKLRQDLIHAKIALELASGVYLPDAPAEKTATTAAATTRVTATPEEKQ